MPTPAAMKPAENLPTLPEDRPVSLEEFIQNDIEVIGQYYDLAIRHDELVRWVQSQVDKRNERKRPWWQLF